MTLPRVETGSACLDGAGARSLAERRSFGCTIAFVKTPALSATYKALLGAIRLRERLLNAAIAPAVRQIASFLLCGRILRQKWPVILRTPEDILPVLRPFYVARTPEAPCLHLHFHTRW